MKVLSVLILIGVCVAAAHEGYFWQLTDVHYDWQYAPGGEVKDKCHLKKSEADHTAGEFGDYLCDVPDSVLRSTLVKMRREGPVPDFIIWGGDVLPHYSTSAIEVFGALKHITDLILEFFPNVTVIPVIGNHDVNAHQGQMPAGEYWLTEELADLWKDWLPSDQVDNFKKGGYYTKLLYPGMRIIVPNTVYCYFANHAIDPKKEPDPSGMFAWMEQVLSQAKADNETVLLTAHLAPGTSENTGQHIFEKSYNKKYLAALSKNLDTVPYQLYGHLHSDTFRVFYDKAGNPASVGLLAPAVDMWTNIHSKMPPNNPGVRLFKYSYDASAAPHYDLQEYIQYYTDLTGDNREGVIGWDVEYAATKAYTLPSLKAKNWHELVTSFKDNRPMFDKYYKYNRVSLEKGTKHYSPTCDDTCFRFQVCGCQYIDYDEHHSCLSR